MGGTVTVVYPQGAKFNMDYYMSTHMPLVAKHWNSYGLQSWKVLKFGDDSPYCVQATLEWDSLDSFNKAASSDSASEVLGDIKNFSDKDPVLMPGEIVGTS